MTSKRQSGTSSKPPLEEVVFFVDRSLGRGVADALQQEQVKAYYHDDLFDQAAKDELWLTQVGMKGWIVLTRDKRIRFRPIEREALLAANVKAFVLAAGGQLTGEETQQIIGRHLPKIQRVARKHPAPFIAGITRSDVKIYKLPGN